MIDFLNQLLKVVDTLVYHISMEMMLPRVDNLTVRKYAAQSRFHPRLSYPALRVQGFAESMDCLNLAHQTTTYFRMHLTDTPVPSRPHPPRLVRGRLGIKVFQTSVRLAVAGCGKRWYLGPSQVVQPGAGRIILMLERSVDGVFRKHVPHGE